MCKDTGNDLRLEEVIAVHHDNFVDVVEDFSRFVIVPKSHVYEYRM